MERLDLDTAPEQPNLEAAIHLARYAIAKRFVAGRKVLDIACGEGYGSHLLKAMGAARVVGVDLSPDTIARARARFGAPGLAFHAADATALGALFPDERFDVVVSFETLEHLTDPAAFLRALKAVAQPHAIILMSCPNDHWHYPDPDQRNPFHVRKYRFDEFRQLTESILGPEVQWSLGSALFGFGSTPLSVASGYQAIPDSWMAYRELDGAFLVSGERELQLSPSQSSYFVGLWNADAAATGAAVFPLRMDDYVQMVRATQLNLGLRLQATLAENALMRERLQALQEENRLMRTAHDRYVRLRNLLPQGLRRRLVRWLRLLRGSGNR